MTLAENLLNGALDGAVNVVTIAFGVFVGLRLHGWAKRPDVQPTKAPAPPELTPEERRSASGSGHCATRRAHMPHSWGMARNPVYMFCDGSKLE